MSKRFLGISAVAFLVIALAVLFPRLSDVRLLGSLGGGWCTESYVYGSNGPEPVAENPTGYCTFHRHHYMVVHCPVDTSVHLISCTAYDGQNGSGQPSGDCMYKFNQSGTDENGASYYLGQPLYYMGFDNQQSAVVSYECISYNGTMGGDGGSSTSPVSSAASFNSQNSVGSSAGPNNASSQANSSPPPQSSAPASSAAPSSQPPASSQASSVCTNCTVQSSSRVSQLPSSSRVSSVPSTSSACSLRSQIPVVCGTPQSVCSDPPGRQAACSQSCVDAELACRRNFYAQQSSVRMPAGCQYAEPFPNLYEACTRPRMECDCNCQVNIVPSLCVSSSQSSACINLPPPPPPSILGSLLEPDLVRQCHRQCSWDANRCASRCASPFSQQNYSMCIKECQDTELDCHQACEPPPPRSSTGFRSSIRSSARSSSPSSLSACSSVSSAQPCTNDGQCAQALTVCSSCLLSSSEHCEKYCGTTSTRCVEGSCKTFFEDITIPCESNQCTRSSDSSSFSESSSSVVTCDDVSQCPPVEDWCSGCMTLPNASCSQVCVNKEPVCTWSGVCAEIGLETYNRVCPADACAASSSSATGIACCMPSLNYSCLLVSSPQVCRQSQGIPAGSTLNGCQQTCKADSSASNSNNSSSSHSVIVDPPPSSSSRSSTSPGSSSSSHSTIINSSRSSSRSTVSTSSQSSIIVVGGECLGNECANGGDVFCAFSNETCTLTNTFPCLACTGGNNSSAASQQNSQTSSQQYSSFSSKNSNQSSSVIVILNPSSSSTPFLECSGNECATVGNAFCALQNLSCIPQNTSPCFSCGIASSSSASSFSNLPLGSPCADDKQCSSNICENGICQEPLPPGFPCTSNVQCSTKLCKDGICQNPLDPNALAFLGETCTNNLQCITNLCVNNLCVACTQGSDCSAGLCRNGICLNTNLPLGASCSEDSQCLSGLCLNNICANPSTLPATIVIDPVTGKPLLSASDDPSLTLPAAVIELPFTNGDRVADNNDLNVFVTSANSSAPSTPSTGPAALAVMLAGGTAGWLYRRRRKESL